MSAENHIVGSWMVVPAALICAFVLSACGPDPEERADVGYDDGYAVGYNTTCKIRATLIEGDWDNEDYTQAYELGYADGAAACKAERD